MLICRYNISGVSLDPTENDFSLGYLPKDLELEDDDEDDELKRKHGHRHKKKKKTKDDCSKPENEDKPHCTFRRKPRYQSKTSPSRLNGPLSPLGYAQWFLPDVDTDSADPPIWQLEYTTYKMRDLLPSNDSSQPPRVPLEMLPDFEASFLENPDTLLYAMVEMESEGDHEDAPREEGLAGRQMNFLKKLKEMTPWKMKDLTIPTYVHLARKLVAEKKLWKQFSKFM